MKRLAAKDRQLRAERVDFRFRQKRSATFAERKATLAESVAGDAIFQ